MKVIGEASFILGIRIHKDQSQGLLVLPQNTYTEHVLKRFNMDNCSPGDVLILKGDIFSKSWCPRNHLKREDMK